MYRVAAGPDRGCRVIPQVRPDLIPNHQQHSFRFCWKTTDADTGAGPCLLADPVLRLDRGGRLRADRLSGRHVFREQPPHHIYATLRYVTVNSGRRARYGVDMGAGRL